MRTTYGTCDPVTARPAATTRLVFRNEALELRWAHCNATANFLSELFGGIARRAGHDSLDARHSIGYLANELLENAVKFRAPGDVEMEASLRDATFGIWLANHVSRETSVRFQELVSQFVSGDPGELLIARIEANAADETSTGSGLGILTLMNDYGVALSWSFEDRTGDDVRLETLASITLP